MFIFHSAVLYHLKGKNRKMKGQVWPEVLGFSQCGSWTTCLRINWDVCLKGSCLPPPPAHPQQRGGSKVSCCRRTLGRGRARLWTQGHQRNGRVRAFHHLPLKEHRGTSTDPRLFPETTVYPKVTPGALPPVGSDKRAMIPEGMFTALRSFTLASFICPQCDL